MDKKTANVYETTNYRKFKKMLDNRDVSPNRVQKIVKSIDQGSVGYTTISTRPKGKADRSGGQKSIRSMPTDS